MKHVHLLRDSERVDASRSPKSRGIGFVLFEDHEHALRALRKLNNNPFVFSKDKRPIVEFALEDKRQQAKRTAKVERRKKQGAELQPRKPK